MKKTKKQKKIFSNIALSSIVAGGITVAVVAQQCGVANEREDTEEIIAAINELNNYDVTDTSIELSDLAQNFLSSIDTQLESFDLPLTLTNLKYTRIRDVNIDFNPINNIYTVMLFDFIALTLNDENQIILVRGDLVSNALTINISSNEGVLTLIGGNLSEESSTNMEEVILNPDSGISPLFDYSSAVDENLRGLAGQALNTFNTLTLDETITSISIPPIDANSIRYDNFTNRGITATITIPSSDIVITTNLSGANSFSYDEEIEIDVGFSSAGTALINQYNGIRGIEFTSQFQNILFNEATGIQWLSVGDGYDEASNTPPVDSWAEGIIRGFNTLFTTSNSTLVNLAITTINNSNFRYENNAYVIDIFQSNVNGNVNDFLSNGSIVNNAASFFQPIVITIPDDERANFLVEVSNVLISTNTIEADVITSINSFMSYDRSDGTIMTQTAQNILEYINRGFSTFDQNPIFTENEVADTIAFSTPIEFEDVSISGTIATVASLMDITITGSGGVNSYTGVATITMNYDDIISNAVVTGFAIVGS